ncbi:hypothetical protein Zm00014a_018524 [Zea mays]|uniref:Uncharacterized protein n=3 Tax=Zea mays TaxID=4577 RepID=B4FRH2_MAIZE|nr:uncharacterized protein LOC100272896 [Zea mays]ACF84715.1 unknown [Zea mays]ONM07411.1 hypothetical protein ZEAMMB73_Zm00001d033366 [Zea mays]ONM07416.1 hypothetical protein ZEAMMB73_Zm00001d033366 [Zea mays]PWZ54811.1 hypothetical protein Zm00014a_018524 [Zea mays]PWZ54812.1 hypothetical protein Zm00014a_018524 [Zea mays]|eukprot:NP_001140821.1 uncharacterized protein LOC100272896 [Zea mays]
MPTAYSLRAPPSASQQRLRLPLPPPPPPLPFCPGGGAARRRRGVGVASASASPFDELHARGRPVHGPSKKSMLWNLIQDIEPLDLSVIQKDVAPETVDAMKRTISGMLGLLPSDQFRVIVEALWNPFFKLLVSSIMTGYTLRNAEYRLSFERNLELPEEGVECLKSDVTEDNHHNINLGRPVTIFRLSEEDMPQDPGKTDEASSYENMGEELGDLTPQAEEYIIQMQSHLNAMKKELHDLRRKNSALQMQQFVGEEKNDLLDYLRSLTPEKVAELSESTSPGVQETIHSVVHGLLATLSPKVHSKAPPPLDNISGGVLNLGGEDDDRAELVENASLPFQPLISVPRDYLARLLFWCMLLGHYIRGLEYRLELARLLRISSVGSFSGGDDHVV